MSGITDSYFAAELLRASRTRRPALAGWLGAVLIAISVLAMCFSGLFKIWPVLLFLLIWFSVLLFKGVSLVRIDRAALQCMVIPLLCLASTLWSSYPSTTLYLGSCFVLLNLCALIMSRAIPFASFAVGLIAGVDIAMLITVLNGHYGLDSMTHTYALTGLFGSKNIVGFVAEVGILTAMALSLYPKGGVLKWGFCITSLLFCVYCLALSHSGTALLSLAAGIGAMGFVVVMNKIPRGIRPIILVASLVLIVLLGGVLLASDAQEAVLKSLGKDSTLTGRTYLWEQGIRVGQEHALLGHGFSAFWVQGNPLAERYWHEFYIDIRAGFHFHSTYVQSFVDLGYVGMGTLALLILLGVLASARSLLTRGVTAERTFLFALAVVFFIRSWVEVDFFVGPFGLGTLLFFSLLPRLARSPNASQAHSYGAASPPAPASAPSPR